MSSPSSSAHGGYLEHTDEAAHVTDDARSSHLEHDSDVHASSDPVADETTLDDVAVSHEEITIGAGVTGEIGSIECPSAESLSDSPLHAGWLTKRGVRLGCLPVWKKRYFLIQGQYIWKFDSPTARRPKGAPIHVLGATCTLGPIDPASSAAAAGHKATMTLSTMRKEYILGAASEEALQEWIDAITRAKAITIKQELGHAPVSQSQAFANRSGAYLMQRRLERETQEVEESGRRLDI